MVLVLTGNTFIINSAHGRCVIDQGMMGCVDKYLRSGWEEKKKKHALAYQLIPPCKRCQLETIPCRAVVFSEWVRVVPTARRWMKMDFMARIKMPERARAEKNGVLLMSVDQLVSEVRHAELAWSHEALLKMDVLLRAKEYECPSPLLNKCTGCTHNSW